MKQTTKPTVDTINRQKHALLLWGENFTDKHQGH